MVVVGDTVAVMVADGRCVGLGVRVAVANIVAVGDTSGVSIGVEDGVGRRVAVGSAVVGDVSVVGMADGDGGIDVGVTDGATAFVVIVSVCGAEVSLPPRSVPPSSRSTTVTTARPLASGLGV